MQNRGGRGGEPPTIQQLCSCEFNLESDHVFPIKPVIAVWGGGWGRGLVCFYARFSFQETLSFPFGQITAAQYCWNQNASGLTWPTGSSLERVQGINKCKCWSSVCPEKSTRTNHHWIRAVGTKPFCFNSTRPNQGQREVGAEALSCGFIASVAVKIQYYQELCSPGC